MKHIAIFVFLLISVSLFSQGEASHWYFGNGAGLIFDVDSESVTSTNAATSTINTAEGCSSISDFNGNLLFYTDGRNVWDKNHQIMPNANYNAGSGLLGDPSSTSSALIIPRPGNADHYYVFTVDEPHHNNAWAFPNQGPADRDGTPLSLYSEGKGYTIPAEDDGYNNGLNYSLLDLTLNTGNGDIVATEKNIHLLTYDSSDPDQEAFKCSEKITAVEHNDGQSYWVLSHFMDVFYAFRVDASGVNTTPVTTQITPNISINGYRRNAIGYMKSSPDGTKLVICHTEQGASQGQSANNSGSLWIYDFDDTTGVVSNPLNIISNTDVYGAAFSPDSSKLYTTGSNSVLQFDLEATDISVTRTRVYNGSRFIAAIQLAPNGKIYAVNTVDNVTLDVINSPNELGALCDYNAFGQSLAKGTYTRLGLPPFIQSFFLAKIEVENLCFGEAVKFTIDSSETYDRISWDFGDGSSPSTADSPTHTYPSAGNYTVMVTLQIGITTKTFSKTFTVTQTPDAIDVSLAQCDEDGVYDGITVFNLNQVYNKVTNNFSNRSLKFFQNKTDAEMDASNNISGDNYENILNPEQLYIQVLDTQTGCYSVAELTLKVSATTGNDAKLETCDTDGTEDGKISFNLKNADALILAGLPTSSMLNYYKDYRDALMETNPLSNNFTNTIAYNQTIFARIENDNDCYGINKLNLVVNTLPEIVANDEILYCLNTYPERITIDAGILSGFAKNFNYEWSTGEKTASIKINEIGTYSVTISNSNGCSKLRTVNVIPSNIATIESITIIDPSENNTVTVLVSGEGDYEYSLDTEFSGYQNSTIFMNVDPGLHTVFVRDKNNCGVINAAISVIGFPKFFTPNGDGFNDRWHVSGIGTSTQMDSDVYIFDRFGKLLIKLNALGDGWNGTYNGSNVSASDYWFYVKLQDGRDFKGHFSLKR